MKSRTKRTAIRWMMAAFTFLAVLAQAFAVPVTAGEGNADNPGVLPPGSNANGMSYGEWAAAWWQWAYSIPADINPLNDPTGENCGVGQSGHVWFLAGSGESGVITRDCTIPAGKALFFPLMNIVWVNYPDDPPFDEESVRGLLAWLAGMITDLSCEIDGVSVENLDRYRVQSPVFMVDLPENNLLGLEPGEHGPAVDDGYYLMLAPLSVGEHTIHFTASHPLFGFSLDVTYNLTVVGAEM